MIENTSTPTDRWLGQATAAVAMPPLTGSAGTAERLLLLVHYGIDWQHGWIGKRRGAYWERILPDRIVVATYRNASLRRWWRDVAGDLESHPRSVAERTELEYLLRQTSTPVLEVLRCETEALVLRTRITADAVRERRQHEAEVC